MACGCGGGNKIVVSAQTLAEQPEAIEAQVAELNRTYNLDRQPVPANDRG